MHGAPGVIVDALRIDDLVLVPPLPALVALLLAAGVAGLGWALSRWAARRAPTPLQAAAGLGAASAGGGALLHALACAHLMSAALMRSVAVGLGLAGAATLALVGPRLARRAAHACAQDWRRASPLGRLGIGISMVTLVVAGIGSLAPAVDGDALNYHLAVAADWLRHGGVTYRPDWFHARLVGFGEAYSALGLAGGTDALGAAMQWLGLLALVVVLRSRKAAETNPSLPWLLAASSPVIVFLAFGQKAQLLPSAGILAGIAVLAETDGPRMLAVACAAVAGALGFKTSYALVVPLASGLVLLRAPQRRGLALGLLAAAAAVFWLPVLARNFALYGDPVSPFLERFKTHPDASVAWFAGYLRDCAGTPRWSAALRLPFDALFSVNPNRFGASLGLGALAFAFVDARGARPILLAAAGVLGLDLLLGQLSPRFLLDGYLWLALAAVEVPRVGGARWFTRLLTAQAAVTAAGAAVAAAMLLPGEVTAAGRTALLERMAPGYAVSHWLDGLVGRADVVTVDGPSNAYRPTSFLVGDHLRWLGKVPLDEALATQRRNGVTVFVARAGAPYSQFLSGCGRRLGSSFSASVGLLPFRTHPSLELTAYRLDWTAPSCVSWADRAEGRGPRGVKPLSAR